MELLDDKQELLFKWTLTFNNLGGLSFARLARKDLLPVGMAWRGQSTPK